MVMYNLIWFFVGWFIGGLHPSKFMSNLLLLMNPPFFIYNRYPRPFEKTMNLIMPGFSSGIAAVAGIFFFVILVLVVFWGAIGLIAGIVLDISKRKRHGKMLANIG